MSGSQQKHIVVVGGGPGGYVAAIRAAQLGARVTLVEKKHLGGTCLNVGCIPTKALLHSAEFARSARVSAAYGVHTSLEYVDWKQVLAYKASIVRTLVKGVEGLLRSGKATVIDGTARFIKPKTVEVQKSDGTCELLEADRFTSEETAQTLMEFCRATGKLPVLMRREIEKFIVNRINAVITNEAYWLVENGYCTPQDVDIACEKGLSHKMGPFRTKDLTGLDRNFLMMKEQYEKTGEKPVGYDLLGALYAQGRYGRKNGHGFYDYE